MPELIFRGEWLKQTDVFQKMLNETRKIVEKGILDGPYVIIEFGGFR